MSDTAVMREIKACIRFYERRGYNWRWAVAFIVLGKPCYIRYPQPPMGFSRFGKRLGRKAKAKR